MNAILTAFGLDPEKFPVQRIGNGHIHQTFKLTGTPSYVLQRVNKAVFSDPDIIASNLRLASDFLSQHYPHYNFLRMIPATNGAEMVVDNEGFPWRLFIFIPDSVTLEKVDQPRQAFVAAREFGKLTFYLDGVNVNDFRQTIPRFHDLELRYQQFETALRQAPAERKNQAAKCILRCEEMKDLVREYRELIELGSLRLRITHNDTKINNVLFDKNGGTIGVIDLDTLMPGYFIYDLGDMIRTFVSPVDEEEKDFSRISFRKDIYDAVLTGYLSSMDAVMSTREKEAIPFAGKMMTYIMALRFTTDFLLGDIYYHTTYAGQNLVRAGNQLRFLELL